MRPFLFKEIANDPKLRVARPTDQLDAVLRFYRDGLGFEVIGQFEDREVFEGVMLGCAGAAT